ncbi:5'-3' exoribonuclease 2 [Smittium mucronatum]|uniref:5'-3' exoribonuclease 1 n=1 Tax=Smittium mucronatum TaxID=133383 RepID=A0A1R0GWU9_9FUNG|nr:5'-3' exoribonuclease 2 [Smittium mucronatum]
MGVPKFFRWIRYPLISSNVSENSFPEFDNLYLDMNGVIHNCTHSNEGDGNLGISENEMFLRIFKYTETLFSKIRPNKLFFIAIDGVAPRAKMNEQRARRFRKIRDLEQLKQQELEKGREIVTPENEFDSNCITPGTEFMERLNEQLKYFINKKISEDNGWKKVDVILSGYNVPGEGEHKIVEYIRYIRSLPDHNPNTRHCLYGLDADLVMLGLSSHEPHFCLLRELLTFSRKKKYGNKKSQADDTDGKFILLNLSILREYLELEFESLKHVQYLKGDIGYDFEKILDDFLLFSMFAGNDFVKNLPGINIGEGALSLLMGMYIKVRPTLGGYIINSGELEFSRLQTLFKELSIIDKQNFEASVDGLDWFENYLINKKTLLMESQKPSPVSELTDSEDEILFLIQKFATKITTGRNYKNINNLIIEPEIAENNFSWINKVANCLELKVYKEYDVSGSLMVVVSTDRSISSNSVSASSSEMSDSYPEDDLDEADIFDFSKKPRSYKLSVEQINVIAKELRNQEHNRMSLKQLGEQELEDKKNWEFHFEEWKQEYYFDKLHFKYDLQDFLNSRSETLNNGIPIRKLSPQVSEMCHNYLHTLQWVVYYYFKGIRSWVHYYPYHYSPKVSDLISSISDYSKVNFSPSKPYSPIEQLMFVLPPGSSSLLPEPLRSLMHDRNSPILDLFPEDFEIDLNGKRNDWEAVSLIDFIDTERVIEAMKPLKQKYTLEDKKRDLIGSNILFQYDNNLEKEPIIYHSSLPNVFPDLTNVTCKMIDFEIPRIPDDNVRFDMLDGTRLGSGLLPGFPTLKTLKYSSEIEMAGLVVFSMGSMNESMIIKVDSRFEKSDESVFISYISNMFEQKKVFTNYPNLRQSKVVGISCREGLYISSNSGYEFRPFLTTSIEQKWMKFSENIKHSLFIKKGIKTDTDVLIHVLPFKGMIMAKNGSLVYEYAPDNERHPKSLVDPSLCSEWAFTYPASLVLTLEDAIKSIKINPSVPKSLLIPEWANDPRYQEMPPPKISFEFKTGQKTFYTKDADTYGAPAIVTGTSGNSIHLKILIPSSPQISRLVRSLGKKVLSDTIDIPSLKSELSKNVLPSNKNSDFNHTSSQKNGAVYKPAFYLCKRLNISPFMLSKITASILVDLENGKNKKINIALTLKLEGKGMRVPGYTNRVEKGWEYSEKAVDLLSEYVNNFRNIINRVEFIIKSNNSYSIPVSDLVDVDSQVSVASIEKIGSWIQEKSQLLPALEPLNSDKFSKEKVSLLEETIDLISSQTVNIHNSDKTQLLSSLVPLDKVVNDRNDVLRPQDAHLRLADQFFSLGDRVVLAADSGVPILCGSLGYIVGINAKPNFGNPYKLKSDKPRDAGISSAVRSSFIDSLDIVWDRTLMSGSDLNGLCSPHRGYSVQPEILLNLSIPQYSNGFQGFAFGIDNIQGSTHTSYPTPEGSYNYVPPPDNFWNRNNNNRWNRGGFNPQYSNQGNNRNFKQAGNNFDRSNNNGKFTQGHNQSKYLPHPGPYLNKTNDHGSSVKPSNKIPQNIENPISLEQRSKGKPKVQKSNSSATNTGKPNSSKPLTKKSHNQSHKPKTSVPNTDHLNNQSTDLSYKVISSDKKPFVPTEGNTDIMSKLKSMMEHAKISEGKPDKS